MGAKASVPRHIEGAATNTGRPVIPAQPFPASFLSALDGVPELKSLFQFPGTEAYLLNNTCWNFDCMQSPSAIFVPKTTEHLQALMQLLSKHPLTAPHTLSVSGGRHSHYGLKNHALVVDMGAFVDIAIDSENRTGRFGAGLRLAAFDSACKKHGLAVTAGTNPDTGIAGLTLGGGFGHLARRHGLSADNLISVTIVLTSGEVIRATADNQHADLLWACRGGGGNFGIVTEFEYKLYPRGDVISGACVFLTRKFTDVQLVLQEWRDYNRTAPRDISCMAVLACGGPVVLPGAYVGDDLDEGHRLLAALVKIGNPLINTYKVMPYCDGHKIGADLQSSALEHQPPGNYYEAGVVLHDLTDAAIAILLASTAPGGYPNKSSQIILARFGGAIADVDPAESAVGFRAAFNIVMILAKWDNQRSEQAYVEERSKCVRWVKGLIKALAPFCVSSYNTLGDVELDADKTAAAGAGAGAGAGAEAGTNTPSTSVSSSSSSASSSSDASSRSGTPPTGSPGAFSNDPIIAAPLSLVSSSGAGGSVTPVDIKVMNAWSARTYARLQDIKTKYDPTNVFTNCNNIKPHQPKA